MEVKLSEKKQEVADRLAYNFPYLEDDLADEIASKLSIAACRQLVQQCEKARNLAILSTLRTLDLKQFRSLKQQIEVLIDIYSK